MSEYMKRYYMKEEEFLDEFHMSAYTASSLLGGEWRPDPSCNDSTRQQREYFRSTGDLRRLVFDGAAVYHDEHGFSHVQIVLKSSERVVNIRVEKINGELVAEKIVDKSAE